MSEMLCESPSGVRGAAADHEITKLRNYEITKINRPGPPEGGL